MKSNVPKAAKEFVLDTFKYVNINAPHLNATIFTLGREEIIPDMFRKLVQDLDNSSSGTWGVYDNRNFAFMTESQTFKI